MIYFQRLTFCINSFHWQAVAVAAAVVELFPMKLLEY